MKKIALVVLSLGLLVQGCGGGRQAPGSFRSDFISALSRSATNLSIHVVDGMELQVKTPAGREFTTFLDNAYDQYRQEPAAKQQIINKYVTALLETITDAADDLTTSLIIPIVKDRAWMADMQQTLLARGATNTPEQVFDEYNDQLVVLYAQDSPKNIRYLTSKDLPGLKVAKENLRALACENLRRILPKIELVGTNGLYMMTAGGNYEASLILLNAIWTNRQFVVQGDYVVAIPTRDLLLITGSNEAEGIVKVRRIAKKAVAEGSYRLTDDLFVYRGDRFVKFDR